MIYTLTIDIFKEGYGSEQFSAEANQQWDEFEDNNLLEINHIF